jgi:hypothetical protein
MAYRLPRDLARSFARLYSSFALELPKNFADIPAIKEIEDLGWKLKVVKDVGSFYYGSDLRRYVRDRLLPKGIVMIGGDNVERKRDDVVFDFSYGGHVKTCYGEVLLSARTLEVNLKEEDKDSLRSEARTIAREEEIHRHD